MYFSFFLGLDHRFHGTMQVKDTQDVEKFAQMLRGLVRGHDNTIHMLQAGTVFRSTWGVALTMFGCTHGIFIVFNLGILGKKFHKSPLFSLGISHKRYLGRGLRFLCCDLGSSSTTR